MRINVLKRETLRFSLAGIIVGTLCVIMAGCADTSAKKQNDFFTSGSNEADQRAEQRMAKAQQLKDTGGAASAPAPSAPASKPPVAKAEPNKSLYDRLGADQGITMIVEDFVPRAMADPRVNWGRKDVVEGGFSIHFARSVEWNASTENIQKLKTHLAQFIALATGGPSIYEGREMQSAHAGLHIANPEFDACVGDLKASLDKLQIPVKEQKELLSIVESTRPQIVEER